jgi:hypothetical protein
MTLRRLAFFVRRRVADTGTQYAHDDFMCTRADLIRAADALYFRIGLYETRTVQGEEEICIQGIGAGREWR